MGKHKSLIWSLFLFAVLYSNCYAQVVVRVSPTGNNTNDGSSWALAKKTVHAGVDAVYYRGGGEVWVKAGTYNESISMRNNCSIYGGFAGVESLRNERNFNVNKSIINSTGTGTGYVIYAQGIPASICIDGFSLKNSSSGILLVQSSSPTITNNTITGNYCGIDCGSSSSPTIINNTINGNDRGIMCDSTSNPLISNNVIHGNRQQGINCYQSTATITNNTVCGHSDIGIYCSSSSPTISNNIVAFNGKGITKRNEGNPVLRNNCVYGNTTDYVGVSSGATDISQDPLIENLAHCKFHIQPNSPCVDAGYSNAVSSSWVDMDGQARVQGNAVDIGADESNGTTWNVTPIIIRVSPDGNDSNDGSSWALAKKTIQAGIDTAYNSSGGGEVWVAAGTYYEHLVLKPYSYLYGGFVGTESQRSERNFNVNKSIIDGSGTGHDVSASEIAKDDACIDGFTIINGSGNNLRGIYCTLSSPIIANNTISGNSYGIYCDSSSSPTITNNTIKDCYDSGIHCNSSNAKITNNIIINCSDGIYSFKSSLIITNNTICINGSGIVAYSGSDLITNNISAFNGTGINGNSSGLVTLKNNCVYGNVTNYSYVTAGTTDISKDPMFVNWKYGKFHIQPQSPCVNAGDISVVDSSWLDMDGQARVQEGAVDIGADESDGTLWTVNSPIVVRVSTNGNDSNNGSSWVLAKKTIQAGIDAAYANEGGEVWVKAGTYYEAITLKTDCDLYGGFAGTESKRSERNSNINKSIINGSGTSNIVTANGRLATACIDGFTIMNSGSNYYGIRCTGSDTNITNNTIVGNGRGIYCLFAHVAVTNCIIKGNVFGIFCQFSNPTIDNNIISENSSYGVYCYQANPAITNNTISGGSNYGILCHLSDPTITNNIVAYNVTGICVSEYGMPVLTNNCFYSNTTNYLDVTAGTTDISTDPLFKDRANGNYHLTSKSPCINTGDNSSVLSGWKDMDGEPRIAGSCVDIGADEYFLAGYAKGTGDSAYVELNDMVVSAVYDGFYYIQDINHSCGIRVNQVKGTMPEVNKIVSVKGVLATTEDGERCLSSYETPVDLGDKTAKSMMVLCKYIGGGDFCYDAVAKIGQKGVLGGKGLNNIGLLLTVCGTVDSIDTLAKRIYINDGSATVAIYYGSIVLPETIVKGAMIKATGACSCYSLTDNNLGRLILLKDKDSIAPLNIPQQ